VILVSLGFLKIILISLLLTFTIRAEVFVSFLNPISAFLFAFAIKKRGGNPLEYLSFFLMKVGKNSNNSVISTYLISLMRRPRK